MMTKSGLITFKYIYMYIYIKKKSHAILKNIKLKLENAQ